jgi:hypothetical protein
MKEKHSITTNACKGENIEQAMSNTQPEREDENILPYICFQLFSLLINRVFTLGLNTNRLLLNKIKQGVHSSTTGTSNM